MNLGILLNPVSPSVISEPRVVVNRRVKYLCDSERYDEMVTMALLAKCPGSALLGLVRQKKIDEASVGRVRAATLLCDDPEELSLVQTTSLEEPLVSAPLQSLFFLAGVLRERHFYADHEQLARVCTFNVVSLPVKLPSIPSTIFSAGWVVKSSHRELLEADPKNLCLPYFNVLGHNIPPAWINVLGEVSIILLCATSSPLVLAYSRLLAKHGLFWLALKALHRHLDLFSVKLDTPQDQLFEAALDLLLLIPKIPETETRVRDEAFEKAMGIFSIAGNALWAALEVEKREAPHTVTLEILRRARSALIGRSEQEAILAAEIASHRLRLAQTLGTVDEKTAIVGQVQQSAATWNERLKVAEYFEANKGMKETFEEIALALSLPGPDTRFATLQERLSRWTTNFPIEVQFLSFKICQMEPSYTLYESLKGVAAKNAKENADAEVKQMRTNLLRAMQTQVFYSLPENHRSGDPVPTRPPKIRDLVSLFVIEGQHHYIKQLVEYRMLEGDDLVVLLQVSVASLCCDPPPLTPHLSFTHLSESCPADTT